MLSKPAMDP
jgi:hypothetical protein